jgi:uncharacterized protein YcbK (DUF882 family)
MDDRDRPPRAVSRRWARAGGLALAALLPLAARAALTQGPGAAARSLKLHHLHTGEKLSVTYYDQGWYNPDAMHEINVFLRDFRTGDVVDMERELFDLLFALRRRLDTEEPYEIISGYRSPETNNMLRRHNRSVATNSLHTMGMAVDVRVPGRTTNHVYAAARNLELGGVGYYPRADFVHLDVGRVRTWDGVPPKAPKPKRAIRRAPRHTS